MAVGFLTILAGLIVLAAGYLYFFGISPEMKRAMEKQALKTMGENKLSYMAKDSIEQIPASDQENIKQFKSGISNIAGGATQNPLGEQAVRAVNHAWDSAQNFSSNVAERVDWGKVQSYAKEALDRVSETMGKSKEKAVQVENKAE